MHFQKKRFRLQTDQQHLLLETFDSKLQSWQKLAELTCERPTETVLVDWLQRYLELKKAAGTLMVSEALVQKQKLASPAVEGLPDIKHELTCIENPDDYWLDVVIDGQDCQAILLAKAAIEMYLSAFKKVGMKLQAVSVLNMPEVNLLDWRQQKQRRQKLKRVLSLLSLPVLVLAILGSVEFQENIALAEVKTQNRSLNQQLNLIGTFRPSIRIASALSLLQAMQFQKGIDSVLIKNQGQVDLAGVAANAAAAEQMLQYFETLAQFQSHSLHDWVVHGTKTGDAWQMGFMLQRAVA